jgi:hypothetical protein
MPTSKQAGQTEIDRTQKKHLLAEKCRHMHGITNLLVKCYLFVLLGRGLLHHVVQVCRSIKEDSGLFLRLRSSC